MSSDQEHDVRRTTDPALVRSVVEDRGGYPAHAAASEGQDDHGLLRIGRHGREEDLTESTWEEFAEEFEEKGLEYRYPDDPEGAEGIDEVGELREQSAT